MRIVLLQALTFITFLAFAKETPEVIPSKSKIIKPTAWYAEQAERWKQFVVDHPTQEAWINYYTAARYAQWSEEELKKIVNAVKVSTPGSFEALLLQSWSAGFTQEGFAALEKAYALNPVHVSTYASMVLFQEMHQQKEKRKFFSDKLWNSGQVSASLLSYSYNVLMSLGNDAILFTDGENTTLPLFILQDVFNVREDVDVLNLDLMLVADYRDHKLKDAGISAESLAQLLTSADPKKDICTLLPAQQPRMNFYYSLTMPQQNISSIKDQLYVVGLASQVSKQRLDNISIIRENLEKRFLLDYLTVDFNGETAEATGKMFQSNYLIPMVLLYEHYIDKGEREKAKNIEALLTKIADETGKSGLINNFIRNGKRSTTPFIPYSLDVKSLEESLRIIKGNIYAYASEVTNEQYNNFLKHLIDTKQTELYERCKIDLSQYSEPTLSFMKSYHAPQQATKKQKFFTQYPVVNISFEAAQAYCEWLTAQYNNQTEKKFKKVKFRLPTISEWQVAAAGLPKATSWILGENTAEVKLFPAGKEFGKEFEAKTVSLSDPEILYPWFRVFNYRNKVLNHKGCSLGNFKFPDTMKACNGRVNAADGFWLMSQVESYFPNDVGLYDVVGNVAEMTDEKGKACGGSWNHIPEESTIKSINEYKGPDASTGFRLFMEVIEQ
jgi:formylglycine-generating enzyme required for sulfatase activity